MKYILESFGEFINEAKRRKKKKAAKGMSKADINKILKDAGFENISMSVDSYHTKTYKPLTKALPGHTVGPMTATSAWRDKNNEHLSRLSSHLLDAGGIKDWSPEAKQYDLVYRFPGGKKDFVLKFMWMQFPLYAHNDYDPGYQRYWLTYVMDEVVPVGESVNEEELFPDVVKVKTTTKITPNSNNPSDRLPAGEYKSTGEETDGMHIYTSKGKEWFLHPEDMDILNEASGTPVYDDHIKKEAERRYGSWGKNGKIRFQGTGDLKSYSTVKPGKYTAVEGDEEGRWFYPRYNITVTSAMKPYDIAIQLAQATGWISPWNYLELGKGHEKPSMKGSGGYKEIVLPLQPTLFDKFDMSAWEGMMTEWTVDMMNFLQGKKLGSLKIEDIRSEFSGMVEFTVRIDGLQLDWMLKNDTRNLGAKKEVYIGISSPNKRGTFEKTVTGRNAENKGVWDKVEDIYNNAYKYKR